MRSDCKRVALGARMIHLTVLCVGTVALFPVIDCFVRHTLPVYTVPARSSLGYASALMLFCVSCAALLARVVEHGHMHLVLRTHMYEEAHQFVEQVSNEYAHLARCSWYQYAIRTNALFVVGAIVAGIYTRNLLLMAEIAALGLAGSLHILRRSTS